jgi:endoglucanase
MFAKLGRKAALVGGLAAVLVGVAALPAQAQPQGTQVYRLTSTLASLALDVAGGSTDSGAPVVQWPVNGGQNQEWTLSGGSYGWKIVNYNSGDCLAVQGASTDAGAPLVQYPCADVKYMEWGFEQALSTGIYVLRNANSNLVVDIPGGTGNWGTQLEQWPSNTGPNQTFALYQVA